MDHVTPNICIPRNVSERLREWFRMCRNDESLELEARLGRCANQVFVAGVDRVFMHALIVNLKEMENVSSAHDGWIESEDFYFNHDNTRLRTRVTFQNGAIIPNTIKKQKLETITMVSHKWDIRFSLSRESAVLEDNVPYVCNTECVRIKQCKTYSVDSSPFTVECAMVWSGVNRTQAEEDQISKPPTFEIECEFTPKAACDENWNSCYPDTCDGNTRLVASLLLKLADIMMTEDVNFKMWHDSTGP